MELSNLAPIFPSRLCFGRHPVQLDQHQYRVSPHADPGRVQEAESWICTFLDSEADEIVEVVGDAKLHTPGDTVGLGSRAGAHGSNGLFAEVKWALRLGAISRIEGEGGGIHGQKHFGGLVRL